ncbi:hypothetical protein KL864_04075 [Mycolicibacterium goodii]|uniref:hypothetical protein n=1 Tax=Mycolicibacterium goodii TaxID=134601 RepID=UPI001BDC9F24|nr:hypothetical protein [Mycolicibacterium goodii]MBU8815084.1 hypothetical protein [Mycolicibacterium goodii]
MIEVERLRATAQASAAAPTRAAVRGGVRKSGETLHRVIGSKISKRRGGDLRRRGVGAERPDLEPDDAERQGRRPLPSPPVCTARRLGDDRGG